MKSSWMKGTIILTASAFFVKLLSLVYKVPYQNIAGDEGLYVFQQIYPLIGIYTTLNAVVLPTIISELLLTYQFSDDIKQYIKRSLWIFGVICFGVLFIGSEFLAKLMGDAQLAQSIQVIGFIFLLIPSLSYWRGVAQCKPETLQYVAYSTTLEQLFRVVAIIAAILVVGHRSVYDISYLAYLGGLIGPIIAIVFLALCPVKDETKGYLKLTHRPHFFKKSVYLFLSAGILILFQLFDSFFIFNSLVDSGIEPLNAMAMKGSYDRGLPIVQTATVFTGAVVSAMIPQLAAQTEPKQRKKVFNASLHAILMLAIPATVGLLLVVSDLNTALFMNNNGIEAIQLLVLQVLFYPFIVFATASLQSEGEYAKLLISILAGLSVKLILVPTLTLNLGITGAALSSVLALAVIAVINVWFFRKSFAPRLIGTSIQIGLATLTMWLAIEFLQPVIHQLTAEVVDERLASLVALVCKAGIGVAAYALVIGIFMLMINAVKGGRKKKKKTIKKTSSAAVKKPSTQNKK